MTHNQGKEKMNTFKPAILLGAALIGSVVLPGSSAWAAEDYVMSCDEIITKLNREATAEGKTRFADLEGSCQGVVERDGELYMSTTAVVRRASSSRVTLYLPATDRTFDISPSSESRVLVEGRKVRPSRLARGQELNIYVSVDAFTQPVIQEVALLTTEPESVTVVPAVLIPTLPTTG